LSSPPASITANHHEPPQRSASPLRPHYRRNITAVDVNDSRALYNPDACRSSWEEYAIFNFRHSTTKCKSTYQQPISSGCTPQTELHNAVVVGAAPTSFPASNGIPRVKYGSISITYMETYTKWSKPPTTSIPAPECQFQKRDCQKQWRSMWPNLETGLASVLADVDDENEDYLPKCKDNAEPMERCVASWADREAIKTRDWFGGCSRPAYDQSEGGFCPYFGWFHN
jgi:hypothetical protein